MKMAFDPHVMYANKEISGTRFSNKNDDKVLKQLCQDFESIFINSLFQEMRKSVPDDGFLEYGMGMSVFQEMMDMEMAREMSRKGGLGLGHLLYDQLRGKQDGSKD